MMNVSAQMMSRLVSIAFVRDRLLENNRPFSLVATYKLGLTTSDKLPENWKRRSSNQPDLVIATALARTKHVSRVFEGFTRRCRHAGKPRQPQEGIVNLVCRQ